MFLLVLPRLVPDIAVLLRISAVALALAGIPLLFYGAHSVGERHHGSIPDILRNRELMWFFAAFLFFSLSVPGVYRFSQVYVKHLGGSVAFLGLFSAVMGVIAVLGLPLMGWAMDRFGPRPLLLMAFLAQPLRALALSFVHRYQLMLLPQLFHLFTWAGLEVAYVFFVMRLAGEGNRATALAIHGAILVLGTMVGAPAAGYLAEHRGYALMFRASAGAAALGAVVFGALLLHRRAAAAATLKQGQSPLAE